MLRANGLSLILMAIFAACLVAQVLFGHAAYNEELLREGAGTLGLGAYLRSGHFLSALMENWESEFLQMGMYVLLTVHLRQRGSAESRPLDPSEEHEEIDAGPTPWPARAGGAWRAIYERSLSIAMFTLFAIAFTGHAIGSWKREAAERVASGRPPETLLEHVSGAQFWFESMQNWQSEFLAVLSLVVLSVFLRQKDSPQSKPVDAPHRQTGS
ncbi:DUF6766 family protein [Dokdonella fugitiva]|jgi:hypothetical protein|uniref:Transmembrane protein n=1 Tax=Dokdonella fugitiva TaxID=328517 RepID=A0A4R2I276_9GAMM|nr:DUF6766 family protein [Dokdonella fugitiva]TCO38183.1 hypothetical protein EV148_10819 [Dokdonella fugitiva]